MSFIIAILIGHFISDFILQNDWMALNKSKDWRALGAHVGVYTLGMLVTLQVWMIVAYGSISPPSLLALGWLGLNALCHFGQDALTSRWTTKLWFFKPMGGCCGHVRGAINMTHVGCAQYWAYSGGSRHWFFVVIGLDQLMHYLTLFGTIYLVTSGV